jgi:hypothetical protein
MFAPALPNRASRRRRARSCRRGSTRRGSAWRAGRKSSCWAAPSTTPSKQAKAVLKRHAGVPFAPKDLRSSFITFLLSDANTDEALKKAV